MITFRCTNIVIVTIVILLLLLSMVIIDAALVTSKQQQQQQSTTVTTTGKNTAMTMTTTAKQHHHHHDAYRRHLLLDKDIALPIGFTIVENDHSGHVSLVWSPSIASSTSTTTASSTSTSNKHKIFMGNARYEFRLSSSSSSSTILFGYPREVLNQNVLLLSILSTEQQNRLVIDGMFLQVWKSGKRIDVVDEDTSTNQASSSASSNQASSSSSTSSTYDSLPPNTPKINSNLTQVGIYTTRRLSYNLPPIKATFYSVPLEVVGEVYQPRNVTSTYKSPLVLFLHGRHAVCYTGLPRDNNITGDWPCGKGYQPIPSHLGYRYIGNLLASQGYIAVSIAANGINAQEDITLDAGVGARSKLIRHHLDLFAKWNTIGGDPWNNTLLGKIDMNNVVLVGHSRGGEGVHRAAIDVVPTDPYKIVGLVSYGPTAYGGQVTPDIHSVTILPTCDGDIIDLEGQAYVDRSRDIAYSEALRSAVTALGCNNNYFNTEWTPGLSKALSEDDWLYLGESSDPVCGTKGSVRLTAQEQQVVGATYTIALIRLAVYQDITMLPLLDGSFVRPTSIGRAEVATSAVGGAANRVLFTPGNGNVRNLNGMVGFTCNGISETFFLLQCGGGLNSPHFINYDAAPPLAYELRWTSKIGAIARFSVRANLTGYDWIDFRIGNDPNMRPVRFDIVVSDRRGRNATLPLNLTTIDGWPGTGFLDRMQARTFRGRFQSSRLRRLLDITRIIAVSLVTQTTSGRVWVLDIAASRRQVVQPTVLNLPVVSVNNVLVKEGSGKSSTVAQVRITPTPTKPGVIWLFDYSTLTLYPLNITVGSPSILRQFPVNWTGDSVYSRFGPPELFKVSIVATKGVVTGNYIGGVRLIEDDPVPILTVVGNTNVTAVEGGSLRWTLQLSAPTDGMEYFFEVVAPSNGSNELYSNDVSKSWLDSFFVTVPTTPVPLSSLSLVQFIRFEYGETGTIDIVIPVVSDSKSEPNESIVLQIRYDVFTPPGQPNIVLVGNVRAH